MHIFLSGSSSLLASAIMESLFNSGHTLHSCPHLDTHNTDIESVLKDKTGGQNIDVVLLLSGEDLFNTTCVKTKIVKRCKDQIEKNRAVCHYFASQVIKPKMILSVSSVYYYANDKNEPAPESYSKGSGFIADYFNKLEDTTTSAEKAGIRVIHLRLGKVISKLAEPVFPRLPFFKKCIPNISKDKNRLISWVSEEDAVRAIHFIWENQEISSPVNIVSGDSVAKDEFTRSIVKKFNLRQTPPLPSFLFRFLFGEEITSIFQQSTRAVPLKLMKAGFLFDHISLQEYYQLDN